MIEWYVIVAKLAIPLIYGAAENRLFYEHGEYLPDKHFRWYHVWLGLLFGFNAIVPNIWLTIAMLFYGPLALDVVWWGIRYYDIVIRKHNDYDGPNPWHERTDWDNYLGLPLVLHCYWWWWVFSFATALFTWIGVTM